ncbi:MAG TPA: hypothetical protein VN798_16430, partial [Pseudomonas sp.]|nr:hypothetical protein [Pseudomonas sp.]
MQRIDHDLPWGNLGTQRTLSAFRFGQRRLAEHRLPVCADTAQFAFPLVATTCRESADGGV